ncbi:3'(2'),5'-bisphosphate nucleotidase CysQ [Campylobacter sp. faydin G-24]|uniref:3'(2'),5'-bisphosphate nucleotidase CysQ n=1 Tax=Campylobacter anatolicus TaxID=2829105 RepID=A0ABS5HGP4_9BACT|nr:inositol monophosphatase family protein [Campylobacter anatolicus]MBR8463288.1 3'(2'),5'-bisphosphate nucleotidase CysQ [Campylobacter anatolicus]
MKDLLNLAKIAAISAGKQILKHYDDFTIKIKSDKSPLTSADIAANKAIFETLSTSNIPICSEEQILSNDKKVDEFWLVDPLDGTKEFVARNGEFCVCIALIKLGRPLLGVIFIPKTNELFYADKNGVFKEILDSNFSSKYTIDLKQNIQDNDTIYVGNYGKNKVTKLIANELCFSLTHIGSAIKFTRVCENGGIYVRFSPSHIWDNAAGDALVSFLGGCVIDINTMKPPLYSITNLKSNHFIALPPHKKSLKEKIVQIHKDSLSYSAY